VLAGFRLALGGRRSRGLRVGELDVRMRDVARLRRQQERGRHPGSHHAAHAPEHQPAPPAAQAREHRARVACLDCAMRSPRAAWTRCAPTRAARGCCAPSPATRACTSSAGPVRDLLLERTPRELDLVVEGDVDAAAAAPGRRGRGARSLRDGPRPRATAAPSTSYALAPSPTRHPGALPTCAGSLDEDLHRRDVTVNAMALDLDGELRAVPGALEDLHAGVLRVLHDRSFIDDPTRVWRVARYAARLGFSVEERTRALAGRPTRPRSAATASAPSCASRCASPTRRPRCRRSATQPALPAGGLRAASGRPRRRPRPAAGRRRRTCSRSRPARRGWTHARCSPGWTTWASPRPSATSSRPPRAS
jgi:hypothetical protein